MSKRLQVLIEDSEYKKFAKQAREEGKSLGEWVRQSLKTSLALKSSSPPEEKMARIRAIAQRNSFPISEIDELLKEIETGYLGDIH